MNFLFVVLPVILLIPIGIYFYLFLRRIIKSIGLYKNNIYIHVILAVLAFLFVYPARNVFGFWIVVVMHLFIYCIICDLLSYQFSKRNDRKKLFMKVYSLGVIPILCLVLTLTYGYWNMNHVVAENYSISTSKQLEKNYRVAFLSDIHYGTTFNKEKLKLYCQEISKEQPDIVVLGGDIVDENTTYQQMNDFFETIKTITTRYGIYYVYGNHDQARYSSQPDFTPEQLQSAIETNNIHILKDSHVVINDEIVLVGRDDARHQGESGRQSSQELLNGINKEQFLLLVDHQPIELNNNSQSGYDLQLSGHTHGGQIFPVGLIIDRLHFGEMNYGYKKIDNFQVIVSSGMAGYGYPIRTGAQSEYEIIDIVYKK